MLFQQDWSLIEECIAAGMAPPDEKLACNQGKYSKEIVSFHEMHFLNYLAEARPRSANKSPLNRPTSAAYYRPRSAARPNSTGSIRPPSASIRPSTDPTKADLLGSYSIIIYNLMSFDFY